jgi:hypothetical protein
MLLGNSWEHFISDHIFISLRQPSIEALAVVCHHIQLHPSEVKYILCSMKITTFLEVA